MKTEYEWCAELWDDEDILDHRHGDKLAEIWPAEDNERLVLIRSTWHEHEGLADRYWAYVEDQQLPKHFEEGDDMPTMIEVPQRFHREIARVNR